MSKAHNPAISKRDLKCVLYRRYEWLEAITFFLMFFNIFIMISKAFRRTDNDAWTWWVLGSN